jgi:protein-S-isoprenylcysteine O-methyltransferase Ste14
MPQSTASVLGLIYVFSELGLALKKRAKAGETRNGDRGSLTLLWIVIVAIAAGHRLIDTGPYRFVRHPSYTGALMAFFGLALCLANWASLAVMLIPVFLVFLRRMHVEEDALLQAFGNQYRDYMRRTKRLIPAVY